MLFDLIHAIFMTGDGQKRGFMSITEFFSGRAQESDFLDQTPIAINHFETTRIRKGGLTIHVSLRRTSQGRVSYCERGIASMVDAPTIRPLALLIGERTDFWWE